MPSSTRPSSAMFTKVVGSLLSFDGSVRRIIAHPGGKNYGTVFAYISSKAFEETLLNEHPSGKTGKKIFEENEWISIKSFLEKMGYEKSEYNIKLLKYLFYSFMQDKALKRRRGETAFEFKYASDLEFPDDDQVKEARESNPFIMRGADRLLSYIPESLANGKATASRHSKIMSALWEAMNADPLIDAFRDEYIYQITKKLPDVKSGGDLTILEVGSTVGREAKALIDIMVEKYDNCKITYVCVDAVAPLLRRAEEQVTYHINQITDKLKEKNLVIEPKFINHNPKKMLPFNKDSVDVILFFTVIHYMQPETRTSIIGEYKKLLKPDGIFIAGQPTSHSSDFPYPLTLLFSATEDFEGYPTKKQMEAYFEPFFKKVKAVGLDAYWVMEKQR